MFDWIERIPYCRQWQAGLILSIGGMASGTASGWASPYIAKLTAPDSTHRLKLTYYQASWITSLLFVGRLIGTILGATIQGFIGRKKTLLCMCLPMTVGWTLILVAPTVSWLYASRIFSGITVGMVFTASASFLGEIADPIIRGSLIIFVPNGISCGSLLGTIMGGFLPVEHYCYVCLGLIALYFVMFIFVPESPYHHMANGDLRKAEKSLQWYKKSKNVTREMDEMQEMIGNKSANFAKIFEELKKPANRKNLLIIYLLTSTPYLAGMNTTEAYAEIILTKSKIDLTPSVVVMFLTFSAVVAGFVPFVLADKVGRRRMLIGSGLGLTFGHVLLGSHFHMLSMGIDPKSIDWLPIVSLFLVYFSIPCGLSTVRDALLGELFPPILKTSASFIFTANSAITSFAVSKSFQPYVDLVGEKFVFWTFATVAFTYVVFSYFCIPETTRMKLKDIQDNFKNINENKEPAKKGEWISESMSKSVI